MRKLLITICFGVILFSCKKDQTTEKAGEGILLNYSGTLDGCGFLIKLDNGVTLEPISIPPGSTLQHNKRVSVRYEEHPAASICMAGITADITRLEYK